FFDSRSPSERKLIAILPRSACIRAKTFARFCSGRFSWRSRTSTMSAPYAAWAAARASARISPLTRSSPARRGSSEIGAVDEWRPSTPPMLARTRSASLRSAAARSPTVARYRTGSTILHVTRLWTIRFFLSSLRYSAVFFLAQAEGQRVTLRLEDLLRPEGERRLHHRGRVALGEVHRLAGECGGPVDDVGLVLLGARHVAERAVDLLRGVDAEQAHRDHVYADAVGVEQGLGVAKHPGLDGAALGGVDPVHLHGGDGRPEG